MLSSPPAHATHHALRRQNTDADNTGTSHIDKQEAPAIIIRSTSANKQKPGAQQGIQATRGSSTHARTHARARARTHIFGFGSSPAAFRSVQPKASSSHQWCHPTQWWGVVTDNTHQHSWSVGRLVGRSVGRSVGVQQQRSNKAAGHGNNTLSVSDERTHTHTAYLVALDADFFPETVVADDLNHGSVRQSSVHARDSERTWSPCVPRRCSFGKS